ncbi:MAG: class I SAM-dependent methyltransferase [Candidatus Hydrogenedentota bacterium]|nr:MAG: class I SAM-dependent methyltransferase [Candidatus Hydrogenedentota bacterium]
MLPHQKLFAEKSELYAKSRPTYPNTWYEYLYSLCEDHEAAWDVGCGTGQVAKELAKYFGIVLATDISSSQIEHAEQAKNVEYSVQSAENTNFEDNTFSLITVGTALHWFDIPAFWKEVNRTLKKNGILAVFGYSFFKINPEFDTFFQDRILEKLKPYWNPRVYALWEKYANVDFPYQAVEVPTFKMEIQWNLAQVFDFVNSWSATRACIKDSGDDFFRKAFEKACDLWGNPTQTKNIDMDFFAIVRRKNS